MLISILHNIRSLHNVGSMFRTADGVGIEKMYLTGITGAPPRSEITKVALGAEECVPWERVDDIHKLIQQLKDDSWTIVALEQDQQSVLYTTCLTKKISNITDAPLDRGRVALIVGNEVDGIESDVLATADHLIQIPMRGMKESLNVAVAFGIAAYQLTFREASQ